MDYMLLDILKYLHLSDANFYNTFQNLSHFTIAPYWVTQWA